MDAATHENGAAAPTVAPAATLQPALAVRVLIDPTGKVFVESAMPPRETASILIAALAQAVGATENPTPAVGA